MSAFDEVRLDLPYGDTRTVDTCTPTGQSGRDIVFLVKTDRMGTVTLTALSDGASDRESPWMSIIEPYTGCYGEWQRCFDPGWGVEQELWRPPDSGQEQAVIWQQTEAYDWSQSTNLAVFRQYAVGTTP